MPTKYEKIVQNNYYLYVQWTYTILWKRMV